MTREEIVNEYFTEHRYDILLNPYAGLLDFAKYLDEHSELPEGLEELNKKAREMANTPPGEITREGLIAAFNYFFLAGKEYQRKQDQQLIELAEDHAMLAGMNKMKEEMMERAVEADVNTYKDLATGESWAEFVVKMPTKNLGDKVKVIVIPEKK